MIEGADAPDAMIRLAVLVSRPEALVLASMLEDHGIPVCVGGSAHASVSVNSLALGGHSLWIPADAHYSASALLIEVLDAEEWGFSNGLRRAVLRFCGLWAGLHAAIMLPFVLGGGLPAVTLLDVPLALLAIPANPQGRGDYNLHPDAVAG
ncbi:hypothetical protein [Novosphingobium sp.]|uniref:hypothetical protein n=1 Tax=Novosphingobium sp. TaxID=1874826 RepID=UPI003BAA205B